MRVITAYLGIGLFIAGCGSNQVDVPVQHLNFSLAMDSTDFARAQSSFAATDKSLEVENTRVTLENLNFQTPRTIERDNVSSTTATKAPTEVVEAQAISAAQQLFPELTLTVLSVDSTPDFHYVTFQQTFENREIVGAKLVLRLLPSGEWVTANSNLVAAHLLASLKNLQALSTQSISSKDFFPQVHQVLKQKSVIYPRSGDNGSLEVFAAREFIVYDLSNHLEFFFWIDEQTNQVVGAFQPTAHVESMRIKGTILPNEPADQAQEVFFPFVSIIAEGGKKSQTDGDGRFGLLSALAGKVQVKLENESIIVVNNEKAKSTLDVDLGSLSGSDVSLDAGPTIEERNIFYWVMHAKKFLKEHLGFTKQSSQITAIAKFGENFDNAFFMPQTYTLAFGAGSKFLKNTSLSRDIIIHEFGHSTVYEKFGTVGGYEFSAMNEAMADFLASTITNEPRIAEGAMQERTGMKYLRTVENDMKYPKDFTGEGFHVDGQIFSGALWDIRKALGAEVADALVHEAQMGAPKSIFEFYRELLKVDELKDDRNPFTPSKHEKIIRQAFFRHGIGSMDVKFTQSPPKDVTEPWRPGCWSMAF